MKLAALYGDGDTSALHLAIDGDGYVPIDLLLPPSSGLLGLSDVGALLAAGPEALEQIRALASGDLCPTVPWPAARLAPPVRRPGKLICVGLNYAAHIEESRLSRPEHIVLFAKFATSLVGHDAPVLLHDCTEELDYEGELAVVIGRRAARVSADEAMRYVAGYTIINDVSARDLQASEPQWLRGKALDTFAPLGPVFLDIEAAPPIESMHIRTRVNGEVRQDASCSLMLTPVPQLLEHISRAMTLEPGDIIATGTPSGVGMAMDPPVFLKPDDVVEIELEPIGTLVSKVVRREVAEQAISAPTVSTGRAHP
ncbi:MAG TPA: fumarylacetoacetate hydrolase family protein [Candidatus Saccharimonadales bacterium]|nr:fumarylacetoacetate hydrolase family protein [Candidatus Saccharimonadales bacterium]